MTRIGSTGSSTRTAVAVALGALLLGACAAFQPPPVPRVPRLEWRAGSGAPTCGADVARAHAALAGAAAGDPAATAAAHAAAATAMATYHACLAQPAPPEPPRR